MGTKELTAPGEKGLPAPPSDFLGGVRGAGDFTGDVRRTSGEEGKRRSVWTYIVSAASYGEGEGGMVFEGGVWWWGRGGENNPRRSGRVVFEGLEVWQDGGGRGGEGEREEGEKGR